MAVAPAVDVRPSAIEVVRPQHWQELAQFLGIRPKQVQDTMALWFTLLAEMGYDLVRTGANRDTKPLVPPKPAPPPALPSHKELYQVVREALTDITERRLAGERISDQAEARAVAAGILTCLTQTPRGEDSATRR